MSPSRYEHRAYRAIQSWKKPKPKGAVGQALAVLNRPIEGASQLVMDAPLLGEVIRKSVGGVLTVANDFAQWSVRPEAIYEEFREAGHDHVHAKEHVHTLDLEAVDRQLDNLSTKYKLLAAGEGVAAGAAGAVAIPLDLGALLLLNLRAIGEHASYCGFDANSFVERSFALEVLSYSSATDATMKSAALGNLAQIARQAAQKQAHKVLDQHLFVQLAKRIAETLGVRLTKQKLAQIVPVMGSVVGGGFNAHFTHKVCTTAHMLYRERFLLEKYAEEAFI